MSSSDKKLIVNTSILYFRTALMVIIGLYTSRVTMQALGVENYGIINAVSGFVSMFSLLSGSLTASGQRFITYEIGRNKSNVSQVFSATLKVFLILAFLLLVFAETGGLYIVNEVLNVPIDKRTEALIVYQVSVFSFLLSLINIPYNSIIVSYEKFDIFAYISILEAVLKLLTVSLLLIISYNSLILYSIFTLISSIIIRIIFMLYCKKHFSKETKIVKVVNNELFKGIFDFAGWSFFGNTATILNNQGINIILNIFCGVTLNAARGISTMVENVIVGFVNNFTIAINPQITKSYAQKDNDRLVKLMDFGMRLSFFLMSVMSIPVIVVIQDILNIWLGIFPEDSVDFIRICLVIATIHAMANPFLTVILATGNIRKYQLTVGIITLINIPIAYILLQSGYKPVWIYYTALTIYLFTFIIRLYFVNKLTGISVRKFYITIVSRLSIISAVSYIICIIFSDFFDTANIYQLFLYGISSCVAILSVIYYIGLYSYERHQIILVAKSKIFKKI